MFEYATITRSYQRHIQDRLDVIQHSRGIVLVVADGAGGTSGGAQAAENVTLCVRATAARTDDILKPQCWSDALRQVDRQISLDNGQSTAVVVAVTEAGVAGASVGDSVAWLIGDGLLDELTASQVRKPLLGSGVATPVAFERTEVHGTFLLASDGLVNYAPRHRICELARMPDLNQACNALVELVRLPSGAFQDDVAIILCRI